MEPHKITYASVELPRSYYQIVQACLDLVDEIGQGALFSSRRTQVGIPLQKGLKKGLIVTAFLG